MVFAVASTGTVTSEVAAPFADHAQSLRQGCYGTAQQARPLPRAPQTNGIRLGGFGRFGPGEDLHDIGEEIGFGSAARVFACRRINTGEDLAVKVINLQWLQLRGDRRKEMEKLNREVEILKHLRHPKIVNLHMTYWTENWFYLVMERVWGGELFQEIVKTKGLKEFEARHVFQQLLEGLSYIHKQGVIHRDLKPENILVVKSSPAPAPAIGKLYDVKIVDFGLSKNIVDGASLAKTFVGTPQYWAPEVLDVSHGGGSYGPAADLWGLGAVLFVMLCGKYPFDGKKQPLEEQIRTASFNINTSRWRAISDEAKDLVCGLLKVTPSDRLSLEACFRHPWVLSKPKADADRSTSGPLLETPELPGVGDADEDDDEIGEEDQAIRLETEENSPMLRTRSRGLMSSPWRLWKHLFGIMFCAVSLPFCGFALTMRLGVSNASDQVDQHQLITRPIELTIKELLGKTPFDVRQPMLTNTMETRLTDRCLVQQRQIDAQTPQSPVPNPIAGFFQWPSTEVAEISTMPIVPHFPFHSLSSEQTCEEQKTIFRLTELLQLQISIIGSLKQASLAFRHADVDLAEAAAATFLQARNVFQSANNVVAGYANVANRVQEVLPDLHLAVEEQVPEMAINLLGMVKQWVFQMRTDGEATRQKYAKLQESVLALARQAQQKKTFADQHLFETMKAFGTEGQQSGLAGQVALAQPLEGSAQAATNHTPMPVPVPAPSGSDRVKPGGNGHSPPPVESQSPGLYVCTSPQVDGNMVAADDASINTSSRLNGLTKQLFQFLGNLTPGKQLSGGFAQAKRDVLDLLFMAPGIVADFPAPERSAVAGTGDGDSESAAFGANALTTVRYLTHQGSQGAEPKSDAAARSSARLLRALRELRRVDSILQGCSSFWTNMDGTLQKLAQMREHTEALVSYATQNAKIKERFQQRLHEYTRFWAALGRICRQYGIDHHAATEKMDKGAFEDIL
jgi:serine/threonine protein kinase